MRGMIYEQIINVIFYILFFIGLNFVITVQIISKSHYLLVNM